MKDLTLPDIAVGTIVITPSDNIPCLTEDKPYIVLDAQDDWIQIRDDSGNDLYYQSHLFIEADVYYNMITWLSIIRILDIDPKSL